MITFNLHRVVAALTIVFLNVIILLGNLPAHGQALELTRIKPKVKTGFANGGWNYDRYAELKALKAGTKIKIADIQGPAYISHIHTTRHNPKELFARGIVIEIWFDEANEPAVRVPLADFFGDGVNGRSMNFSGNLIECAPWSYNSYIPMPFRKSAQVYLVNDTKRDCMNYSYVEWETLPAWQNDLGYFHATYKREAFQLTKESDVNFFEVQGSGHFLGRQFSVITDELLFREFNFVMEGNNEIDIDGEKRSVDYLGTEDSFTFSWGFNDPFGGRHAGMPFIDNSIPARLSIYRFHDHMPIRFNKSLKWNINWTFEHNFTKNPEWGERVKAGGCWVDYATVFYWYMDAPGGYRHADLGSLEARMSNIPRPFVK